MTKHVRRLFFFLALLNFQSTASVAAEQPIILRMREDRILQTTLPAAVLVNDPFNWSTEQISLYRKIQAEKNNVFADLTIQAILWNQERPYAVVNNQIVTTGEGVRGVVVDEILQEKVIVEHNGNFHTLFLKSPLITSSENKSGSPANRIPASDEKE